jgi:dihydropteroate synthase
VDKPGYINAGGKIMALSRPIVMGIVNVTPDSFYSTSRQQSVKAVLDTVSVMVESGADIIDIGGCSTRPGSVTAGEDEERERLITPLKALRKEFPSLIISVDTYRAAIARAAVAEAGANMINDISGGTMDSGMYSLVAELRVPYIMMHIQGTPSNMNNEPEYDDVVSDIIAWFGKRISLLFQAGVTDLILDPGIGFGKTTQQNFEILSRLSEFSVLGLPLMVGLSRKSLIWKTLSVSPEEALTGTIALNMAALMNGADILRVHDVLEAVETVKLYEKMRCTLDKPL